MRRYFSILDTDPGGGGGDKLPPPQPKGYTPLSVSQRADWNGFLDYASKQNGVNLSDPKQQAGLLASYKKANPNFSITPDKIPAIQYEAYQLRKGDSFGNLNAKQLDYIRQGMNPNYLNADIADLNKTYYPQTQKSGTDIEGYYNSKTGIAPTVSTPAVSAPAPGVPPSLNLTAPKPNAMPQGAIARPNYTDPASRINYLKQWTQRYGNLEGRGDTILKLNEIPRAGSDTSENIAKTAASKYNLDPALLHVSGMEEGESGLFKDLSGKDTKGRKPTDFGYEDYYGDKDYPINGGQSFGFQTFNQRFPDLVKGGYLPKEFAKQFRNTDGPTTSNESLSANDFKTVESAMQAKAAMIKYGQDYVDRLAKQKGIELSDNARNFFTLAWFNGGEGGVLNRLVPYSKKGLLKEDQFLKERPDMEKGKPDNLDVWEHVTRRIKMAENLKKEGYFSK